MNHAYLYFLVLLAARTAIVAIFLVVGFRLLGKRQIGQMNVYDIALIMALANAVQNAMTSGAGDLSAGITCAGTLLLVGSLFGYLFAKLPRFEKEIVGNPTTLLYDGEMLRSRMNRESISEDELMAALRAHGLCDPSECKLAVLEVDGSLSIVPAKPGQEGASSGPAACDPDKAKSKDAQ